jgi:phosphoglycerate dehydrogenase-like enzyme
MKVVSYIGAVEGYEAAAEALAGVAEVEHVPAEAAAVAAALARSDALLDASMKVRITDRMAAAAPGLRVVSCATTGADHIERGVLGERGVAVRTLKEDPELLRNITPAAELSWALLMACARRLPAALAHVKQGDWVREEFPGIMLNGRTLGLVGCGRIGGWMARYARAFGMEVIGYDPFVEQLPDTIRRATLEEVFEGADFVSVHVHLSPETEGLVSASLLARARPGVVLINTSRGQIVDEAALLEGLRSGHVGAAGLDVLTGEPEIESHPLVEYARTHDNLLITPHCGGYSRDAVRVVCRHAALKIRRVLEEAA